MEQGRPPWGQKGTVLTVITCFNLHNLPDVFLLAEGQAPAGTWAVYALWFECVSAMLCEWRFISKENHFKTYIKMNSNPRQTKVTT